MSDSGQAGEARERISRVFQYLCEYERIRAEPKRRLAEYEWVLRFGDLPAVPTISIGESVSAADEAAGSPHGADYGLEIRRPATTSCPPPSAAIREWVQPGWERFPGFVERVETKNRLDEDGATVTEKFSDDPARVAAFGKWEGVRANWVIAERPVRAALEVYERVYRLRSLLEREGDRFRLLLGDGALLWEHVEGRIDHPMLLQEVELLFNPDVPSFTVRDTDAAPELHDELLSALPDLQPLAVAAIRRDLAERACHPLEGEATTAFLRHLVQSLWSNGEFLDQAPRSEATERPTVHRAPVLFLAPRTAGRLAAFRSFIEAAATMDEPPEPLARIVGIDLAPARSAAGSEAIGERSRPAENPAEIDLLCTQPANPAQEAAIRSLESSGAVLVQGPPGTGKSHTIANLIGHLLARGKSVLVTSHTAKALRVVREKVSPELRDLCVSVIDSDLEGRRQLEVAIAGIVTKLSTGDRGAGFQREATALGERRSALRQQVRNLERDLLAARRAEFEPIVVAGQATAPPDAARVIAETRGKDDWVPGPLRPGAAIPLELAELGELYELTRAIPAADEAEAGFQLPDPRELPSGDEYRALLEQLASLERGLEHKPNVWAHASQHPAALDEAEAELKNALDQLDGLDRWLHHVVEAGINGGLHAQPWRQLTEILATTPAEVARHQLRLAQVDVEIPADQPHGELLEVCGEISESLRAGNSLGRLSLLLNKRWRQLCETTAVDGRRPENADDFRAIESRLRVEISRAKLAKRWDRQVVPLGGPAIGELGPAAEVVAPLLATRVKSALDWPSLRWASCQVQLQSLGLRLDDLAAAAQAPLSATPQIGHVRVLADGHVLPALRARRSELALEALRRTEAALRAALGAGRRSTTVERMFRALEQRDPSVYAAARDRILRLHETRQLVERRKKLLARVAEVAPSWAKQLQDRTHPTAAGGGVPGDALAAWLHRQWVEELDRRGQVSLDQLQRKLADTKTELQRITAAYVERLAWAYQVSRTSLAQQQALVGYSQYIRKIGKATGRRAPTLKREANRLLAQCRAAVPVWIMPLARALESFHPQASRFDVVIIDEASQCDISGFAALGLGKQVVVVGDHEQVSPLAVGQKLDKVAHLIEEYLQGIPNRHLYDGRTSVYDLAQAAFGNPVRLEEHFRCVPEIIAFSNHLSYEGRIRPLREEGAARLRPFVIGHRVDAGNEVKAVNLAEADELASLVVACCEQPEYKDATMGVISLLGDQQAGRIDEILRQKLDASQYERRRIVCGGAAHFQGDEREVMFLSMVWSPSTGPLAMNEKPDFKQRLNVAASRARDQMWLVYSLDPELDLKPGDLRRRLIEHVLDPSALKRQSEEVGKAESDFEKQVLARLIARGYRVVPQWRVGAYRIDVVVVGAEGRVAIECDGDRYHTIDELDHDLARQSVLERMGWRFIRIRGTKFYRAPDETMEAVFSRLFQLGIEPLGPESVDSSPTDGDELRRRVVRRAEQLRAEWQSGTAGTNAAPPTPPEPSAAMPPQGGEVPRPRPLEADPAVVARSAAPTSASLAVPPVDNSLDVEEIERAAIKRALERTQDDEAAAAKLLGMDRSTLYRKLDRYEIEAAGDRPITDRVAESIPSTPPHPAPPPVPQVPAPPEQSNLPAAAEPAARPGAYASAVDALIALAPDIGSLVCEQCGGRTRPRITEKGLVLVCQVGGCRTENLIATALLQQVCDAVGAMCFECGSATLRSQRASYGSFLKCRTCGRNNYWSGIESRLKRPPPT